MNKCTDGKQMTYTREPCEKLGLNTAGPIKDAVTVVPVAPKPQKDTSENSGEEHTARNDVSRAATFKPVNPLVDKMLNWLD
jgi:hypothetical protein